MGSRDLTGRTIQGYHLFKKIGEGGFGSIYQANHPVDQSVVAVKTLHRELLEDKDVVERFQREARSLATLQHPNIVQLIDFNWDDDVGHFMVLEWLPGGTMMEHMRAKGLLSLQEAFYLFEQLLSGLGEAHNQGIVHRDLKPGNVFLVPEDQGYRVKILDFGLALLSFELMRRTRKGAVMGSSNYMSPEQAMGKTDLIDMRTDIYSCGCLLAKCLTGRTPFRGNAYEVAMIHYHKQPFPSLHELCPKRQFPEALEQVYLRALSRDPAERFGSCYVFYQALQEALLPYLYQAGQADDPRMMETYIAPDVQALSHSVSQAHSFQHAHVDIVSQNNPLSGWDERDSGSLDLDLDSALDNLLADGPSQSNHYVDPLTKGALQLSSGADDAFAETSVLSREQASQAYGETHVLPLEGEHEPPTTTDADMISRLAQALAQDPLEEELAVGGSAGSLPASEGWKQLAGGTPSQAEDDSFRSLSGERSSLIRSNRVEKAPGGTPHKRPIKMRGARVEPPSQGIPSWVWGAAVFGGCVLVVALWFVLGR